MFSIDQIQISIAQFINRLIREEFVRQGHSNTGAFEESLNQEVKAIAGGMEVSGTALEYGLILNEGVEPGNISNAMFPGLVKYFVSKGLPPENAKRAAGATINKWKQEGMSTQASKQYSSTGSRHHFIEAAMIGHEHEINEFAQQLYDFGIDDKFSQSKNETI
jgi:hypothetical protein